MKKNVIVAGLLALSVNSFASESNRDAFIGLEIGSANISVKASADGESVSDSESETYFSLKGGKYINSGRILASYTNYNVSDASANAIVIGYDYLFENKENSALTPYIGANIGYANYEIDDTLIDISGMTYGVGAGVLFNVNKNVDIDFNLRYNLVSADDTVDISGTDVKLEIESALHIGFGVNYNF